MAAGVDLDDGLVATGPIDGAAGVVAVVVAHPVGQIVAGAGLVAALWRDVEEGVGPKEALPAAGVGRIGVEDVAVLVLVEHAAAGQFVDPDLTCFVVEYASPLAI